MRFAVFISGRGSNLKAIIEAVQKGQIKGELALVLSSSPKAGGLKFAEEARIKTLIVDPHNYTNPQSVDRDIVIQLKEAKIDLIVLAGYMRLLTPFFVKTYHRQIINVHPSLLPSFKGVSGIKDAFTYGVKVTGVTVHFVDEKMDSGPIILQKAISVSENETLESLGEKIHKVEHEIYPKAIELFVEGKLKVRGRKVQILP
ncbi:MAG: phosphoribosylglycinamide formyltransferase [Candidatus Omnitrophica bacterium]|nr:phosphoribosylglycinamide formyltransferase [Candidatus Omnitrophota bacterium]